MKILEVNAYKAHSNHENCILKINLDELLNINIQNTICEGFWIEKTKSNFNDQINNVFVDKIINKTLILDSNIYSADLFNLQTLSNKSDIYFYFDRKSKNKDYEKIFYSMSLNAVTGICLDIDFATKGLVSLCNKFELKPMLANAIYERHLDKAKNLGIETVLAN